ncbi:MAG: NADP-dependent oxidoreductase [Thermomicrobiales bacterium]
MPKALALLQLPGELEVIDIDMPTPGPGELLVRVVATSMNGFDMATIAGYLQGMMEHRFPLVPGKDFAGTVVAVGERVEGFSVGDDVFGVVSKDHLGTGSFAEYVTLPASVGVAHRPESLPVAVAGALGLAGAAAHDSVGALGDITGKTVLISGATGGVGTLAVQLAANGGAHVIATAKGDAGTFFEGLTSGTITVVDYTGDLDAQVRAVAPAGVDAAVHLAGDLGEITSLVRDGGSVFSAIGQPESTDDRNLNVGMIMANPARSTLDELAELVANGTLTVPLSKTFKLEEAANAVAEFAAGARGKISINVS